MTHSAKELLALREDQRRADRLRSGLPGLRVHDMPDDDAVLTDWSRRELTAIGRTSSTPDSTLTGIVDPERLTAWLADLEHRADLGSRLYLGTSLRYVPWLACEVTAPGWLARAWTQAGGTLRVVSGDRWRLLVVFDEEHAVEGFSRTDPVNTD